jgi:thymidine kinase
MAKLYFIYGAMGCGKTIDLLKTAYNYEERGQKVLLFTASKDTRNGVGKIKTRVGLERDAIAIDDNMDIYKYILTYPQKIDCILVDEVNFLKKEHIDSLSDVVDFLKIPVMCYGLRSDFLTNVFEGSKRLLEIADSIQELKTICECGRKAIINMRISDGKVVTEGEQFLVGGNESYKAVCRRCYKDYISNFKD